MPSVVRRRDVVPLGAQQPRRLQQLRDANEQLIQQRHLSHAAASALTTTPPPLPQRRSSHASRTVEAIIERRLQSNDEDEPEPTAATRLRETIRAARGGIHTERASSSSSRLETTPITRRLHQKIVSVRRYGNADDTTSRPRRHRTSAESEWLEKQALFVQRAGVLEKDCLAWWHSFYASSSGGTALSAEGWKTAMSVQKLLEESDRSRREESSEMHRQLCALQDKCHRVTSMVHDMRDGVAFFTELQQEMDSLEQGIASFRREQRVQYDHYAVEEKILERELVLFLERTEVWETEDAERKSRPTSGKAGGGSSTTATRRPLRRTPSDREQKTAFPPGDNAVPAENELVARVRRLNQQILASGGLKGGWDDREHAVFTSVLQRCGLSDAVLVQTELDVGGEEQACADNQREQDTDSSVDYETRVARFVRKCSKALVTRSESSVRTHLAWYISHVRLVHDKKEALERWRQEKAAMRQRFVEQGLERLTGDGGDSHGDGTASTMANASPVDPERKKVAEAKERQRQAAQLDAWRQGKEAKEQEKREQEAEERRTRAAMEARRRQELLEKKQQVMLYRLQKEQDAQLLARNDAARAGSASPQDSARADKAELQRRSKMAIEAAKARRAKLEARSEQERRQRELPERPKSVGKYARSSGSPNDSSPPSSRSPVESTLQRPTKAVEARHVSKVELRRQEKRRAQQGAHETYFPGAGVVADAKLKSFGHVPIAPRAVPSWRQNLA
ncbi:hypothetical protein P43SY_008369 [Pythium insidiosum]|uniref:Coiled-coil domain-containing protein n=1 Tax=Pythium insidiosum TaxID=114742 RepID=A0AAD5M8Q0_PYTIN|nr:hypothetical protein P43SY_008369 [Pythium insidiosum]